MRKNPKSFEPAKKSSARFSPSPPFRRSSLAPLSSFSLSVSLSRASARGSLFSLPASVIGSASRDERPSWPTLASPTTVGTSSAMASRPGSSFLRNSSMEETNSQLSASIVFSSSDVSSVGVVQSYKDSRTCNCKRLTSEPQ